MGISDSDKRLFELLKNVPRMIKPLAILALILNILLPGSGSVFAGCLGDRDEGTNLDKTMLACGLF